MVNKYEVNYRGWKSWKKLDHRSNRRDRGDIDTWEHSLQQSGCRLYWRRNDYSHSSELIPQLRDSQFLLNRLSEYLASTWCHWTFLASTESYTSTGIVNQKLEPFPASDWTSINPFINLMSSLEIDNPSPVPPNLLVDELSACWNGTNKDSLSWGDKPIADQGH